VRYAAGDYVYVNGVLPDATEYSVVRELRNPDRAEFFAGQHRAVAAAGQPYSEVGRIKIVAKNNKSSVAYVESSCEELLPGDFVIPLQQREPVVPRHMIPFNRFPSSSSALRGRIVLGKDFTSYEGAGSKVYLNIGSDQGVKPGDYFRAVRAYGRHLADAADRVSYESTVYDDVQAHPVMSDVSPVHAGGTRVHLADLPERALGELIILSVTPKSSTAMIAFSLEDVQVGDYVERDELPPATAAESGNDNEPPQISCGAQPDTVRVGGASLIACETSAADGQPVSLSFITDRGKMESGADHGAVLQTAGLTPGEVHITATATDSRNLKNTAEVTVNVEAASLAAVISEQQQPRAAEPEPPAPSPMKVAEIRFSAGSNILTNDAKTQLNEIAVRLDRERDTKVVIIGQGNSQTPAGQRLAQVRADNIKNYLVNDRQVDASRIEARTTGGDDKAEIWFVPPGAEMK
jgi:outer membrane protein OmpA-like peptidoglycan-associated protein